MGGNDDSLGHRSVIKTIVFRAFSFDERLSLYSLSLLLTGNKLPTALTIKS